MAMNDMQRTLARGFLADQGTSAAQSIQIENATGGTFTISFDGQTTAAIVYNAGANVVQNALCALSNVGIGNLTVVENQGVPGSLFYVATFGGELANAAQAMFTVSTASLTGAAPLAVVSPVQAGGVTAFSDTDLDNLYDFTAVNGGALNFALAIAYGFDELLANGAKFNDYVAGQTQEKKSQITAHLKERAEWWHLWANATNQVQIVGMVSVPPQARAVPVVSGVPATSIMYDTGYPYNRWYRMGR